MKRLLLLSALVFSSSLAFAQQRDYAQGNRLYINGQPLFISGMNIAWHDFARDVGDGQVNINAMVGYFNQIKEAGGNAVRWWLHTDAQTCPKINDNGQVTGLGSKTISNIKQVLDSAQNYGIVVSLTLFSFDLLNDEGGNKTTAMVAKNEKFLTEPANLDTYIEKGLRPILDAVGSHPAIMCWEVFNEPEGMVTRTSGGSGWSSRTIDYSHVIRFTAKIAAEVHKRTTKMASTGIHEFNKQNYFPKYTIAELNKAADGDKDAYLDFYMAHHYPEYIGTTGSPFKNPASFWGLEKPVLIGEFPARDWSPPGYNWNYNMTIKDAYEYAYDNGYCGAMSWSMTEGDKNKFGSYTTTKPALENLFSKHQSDIQVIKGGVTPSSSSRAASSSSRTVSSSSRAVSSSSRAVSSSSRAVSSSSRAVSSSSRSSSSGNVTSILVQNSQQDEIILKYYTLQGQSLGNIKPKEPGVYLVKNIRTKQIHKVVVK
jgi:hypothetical protein